MWTRKWAAFRSSLPAKKDLPPLVSMAIVKKCKFRVILKFFKNFSSKRNQSEIHSDHSMTSDHSDFTDIATRCNMAVVHKKGAEVAEAINVSQSKEQGL